MKKLIIFLSLILIAFNCNSQAVSRATLMTPPYSWNQRAVPNNSYANSTWASFYNIINNGTPWSTKGQALGTNTAVMGPTDNRSLNFINNNTQKLKIDSLGILRMTSVTSSLVLGSTYWTSSAVIWYDNYWGLSNFHGHASGGNNYQSGKTDSVVWHNTIISRNGNPWDGEWFGTSNKYNINFAINMNAGNQPLFSVVQASVAGVQYFVSNTCINPAVSNYTCDANLRVNSAGNFLYSFKIDSVNKFHFAIDTAGNMIIQHNFINGVPSSTAISFVPSSSLQVIGSSSVSTTSTLTGNINIGGSFNSGTTLNVVGSMSVSDTPTLTGDVYAVGALSVTTTFSAGGTSTLTGNVRIGSTVAPSQALHVAGTMSVSDQSYSGDGVRCIGALTGTSTFSAGTTSTLVGATRIGGTAAPVAKLDVTGTMSVSGTATINGIVSLPNYTPTAVACAIVLGSATLDFPSTTATTCSDLTIAVVGARLNDAVAIGVPNGSVTATAVYWGWVSATDVVKIRFSPKATEDPASGTFKVIVCKN